MIFYDLHKNLAGIYKTLGNMVILKGRFKLFFKGKPTKLQNIQISNHCVYTHV